MMEPHHYILLLQEVDMYYSLYSYWLLMHTIYTCHNIDNWVNVTVYMYILLIKVQVNYIHVYIASS